MKKRLLFFSVEMFCYDPFWCVNDSGHLFFLWSCWSIVASPNCLVSQTTFTDVFNEIQLLVLILWHFALVVS